MKQLSFSSVVLLFTAAWIISCQKEVQRTEGESLHESSSANTRMSEKTKVFKGPQVHIGNGKMRSFITISPTGKPLELGVEFTAGALQGLPSHHSGAHHNYLVAIHKKAEELTPFDHIEVNWNPSGHAPTGVYSVPHFDLHFYTITVQQQMAIPPYSEESDDFFDNFPPSGYLPADYFPTPRGEARMGKHWIDVKAPEFNGQPFTKTFIYGTYDGSVIFYEPMITKAYLESTTSVTTPIKVPDFFSPADTYYPTEYKVHRDASSGNYSISLSGFKLR